MKRRPGSWTNAVLPHPRLDSPQAAHRTSRQSGLQGRGHLLRGSRHDAGLRPGVQHRLSSQAADACEGRSRRPAMSNSTSFTIAVAARHTKDRQHAGQAAIRSPAACRSSRMPTSSCRAAGRLRRKRSCFATPPPMRSSSFIAASGRSLHHVRRAAVPAVRLRRHSAHDDVSLEFDADSHPDLLVIEAAGKCRLSAALSESGRPVPARSAVQRARFARPDRARRNRRWR